MYEFSCFPKFICDNKTLGIWIINRDLRAIVSRLRNSDGDTNDPNNTITFEKKPLGGGGRGTEETGRMKGQPNAREQGQLHHRGPSCREGIHHLFTTHSLYFCVSSVK